MARTKSKKSGVGSVIYAFFLILFVVAAGYLILWFWGKLWVYATEYEGSQSKPVIEAYMDRLRENLWDDSIAETVSSMPHEFQTDEECGEVIRDLLRDQLSYSRAPGGDSKTEIYNLLCGKNLFGKVTLVQDLSRADELEFAEEYGLYPWKVYKEEFYFDGLYTATQVTVPSDYKVFLNGHELGEEYLVETGIPYDVLADYYSEFPSLPTKVTYRAERIIGRLEPEIYNAAGELVTIDPQRDDSQFIPPVDDATKQRLTDFAWAFADKYLAFSTGASDMTYLLNQLKPYVVAGSDLDSRLKGAVEGYVGYQHNSQYRFGSAWLNDAMSLGNGNYVIYIGATASSHQPQGYVDVERNMKVLVVDSNTGFHALSVEDYEPGGN